MSQDIEVQAEMMVLPESIELADRLRKLKQNKAFGHLI